MLKSIIFNQHQVNHALKNKEGMFRVVVDTKQSFVEPSQPYGKLPYQVGEEIFVKEKFAEVEVGAGFGYNTGKQILYGADDDYVVDWKPAQHMKQEHSRLTLRIKSVKVERLADINEDDAAKESGVFKSDSYWHSTLHPTKGTYQCWTSAREAFAKLWNSTHKKPEEKWEANPWVWAITFKRIENE